MSSYTAQSSRVTLASRFTLAFTLLAAICACSGGGGGSGSSGPSVATFRTSCGVVSERQLQPEFSVYEGQAATLDAVVTSQVISVRRSNADGTQLPAEYVQLFGVRGASSVSSIKQLLASYVGQTVYLVTPATSCTKVLGNGALVPVYQVVTGTGDTLSEILIRSGLSDMETAALGCGEEVYAACLSGDGTTSTPSSNRQVSNFLWKPSSESPHNPGGLSILFNPCDADVYVNGDAVLDFGPSNGRCVTARTTHSGCAHGENIEVRIIDHRTGEPVYFGASPSLTIPNGCERVEYASDGSSAHSSEELPACSSTVSDVSYYASRAECGGNAAVVLSGSLQSAFSVQLRLPDNSDRLDLSCSENGCSPYKVQQYIDGVGTKTACFGAPGNSVIMSEVVQTTIKRTGDDRTPLRLCIANPGLDQ